MPDMDGRSSIVVNYHHFDSQGCSGQASQGLGLQHCYASTPASSQVAQHWHSQNIGSLDTSTMNSDKHCNSVSEYKGTSTVSMRNGESVHIAHIGSVDLITGTRLLARI